MSRTPSPGRAPMPAWQSTRTAAGASGKSTVRGRWLLRAPGSSSTAEGGGNGLPWALWGDLFGGVGATEGEILPHACSASIHQAPTPLVLLRDCSKHCLHLVVGRRRTGSSSLPRQQRAHHLRENGAQEGRLWHVLHLADVEDGSSAATLGHTALGVCDVLLDAGLAPEVVLAADEQEGHRLRGPMHRRRQAHGAPTVDDDCGWDAGAEAAPQARKHHLTPPGAHDEAIALLDDALVHELRREGL
mmetsp:Transcript_176671/g.566529  ORF Transcript_176671/g.566529 Transcript_176671/m.566529 type:complete len:245 (-) Transcript_176671:694-1428(-)